MLSDEHYMRLALEQATVALHEGEVPVGCVFVDAASGDVLFHGHNLTSATRNATQHAEVVAIDACYRARGSVEPLRGSALFVTVEPCIMCSAALQAVGVGRAVFGCRNDKFGGCGTVLDVPGGVGAR